MSYDLDKFVNPPDPELVCSICTGVLSEPVECACRHVFCKVCIERWLKNGRNCPTCRKVIKSSKLIPVLPIVMNMINRLKMTCDYSNEGCQEVIALEWYNEHIRNCEFAPHECMNGCGVTVLRKKMIKHERKCAFRMVLCKAGCDMAVKHNQRDNHSCIEELKNHVHEIEKDYDRRIKELEGTVKTTKKEVKTLKAEILELQEGHNATFTYSQYEIPYISNSPSDSSTSSSTTTSVSDSDSSRREDSDSVDTDNDVSDLSVSPSDSSGSSNTSTSTTSNQSDSDGTRSGHDDAGHNDSLDTGTPGSPDRQGHLISVHHFRLGFAIGHNDSLPGLEISISDQSEPDSPAEVSEHDVSIEVIDLSTGVEVPRSNETEASNEESESSTDVTWERGSNDQSADLTISSEISEVELSDGTDLDVRRFLDSVPFESSDESDDSWHPSRSDVQSTSISARRTNTTSDDEEEAPVNVRRRRLPIILYDASPSDEPRVKKRRRHRHSSND